MSTPKPKQQSDSEYQCQSDSEESESDCEDTELDDINDELQASIPSPKKRSRQSRRNAPSTSQTQKKKYQQKFRKAWLNEEDFKEWLSQSVNGDKALCKYCNALMEPKRSVIKNHLKSNTHVENAKPYSNRRSKQTTLDHAYFVSSSERVTESRMALYTAVHCSILSVNHLTEVCTSLFGQNYQLKRTKCAQVIMNIWYPHFITVLKEDIDESKYSLIIDESTDISVFKMLGIVIRYYSQKKEQIVTTFLDLVRLENGNAESIANALDNSVNTFGLKTQNCIGLGTDNASVMTGINNGVRQKLIEKWGHPIVLVRCVCHSIVLAVNSACEELPRNLEFMVRETYNWFSHSTNRREAYKKVYESIYKESPLQITQICATRWLSIYKSIERVLAQWDVLQAHFEDVRISEKCYTAEVLSQMYQDDKNFCYLVFLKRILEPVAETNKTFQSNNDPFKLIDGLILCIHSIAGKVLNKTARVDIFKTDDLRSYLDPKPDFGHTCESKLLYIQKNDTNGADEVACIRTRCISFALKLLSEMKNRLPDNFEQLRLMNALTVENTLKQLKDPIVPLMNFMGIPAADRDSIETQWSDIVFVKWPQEVIKSKNSMLFWTHVANYTDAAGTNPFKKLSNFVLQVLSLPLSNAEVERIFSMMNFTKSKTRNRMGLRLLVAILAIKCGLKLADVCCYNYQIPSSVLKIVGTLEAYKNPNQDDDADKKSNEEIELQIEEMFDEFIRF